MLISLCLFHKTKYAKCDTLLSERRLHVDIICQCKTFVKVMANGIINIDVYSLTVLHLLKNTKKNCLQILLK